MYPDFISHYHLPDRPPFLSLSDLEGGIDDQIFQNMLNRHKWDENYNRRFGLDYLKTRVSVENKLRDLFIRRGGKPKRQYPIYFVLGESKWFQHLNTGHRVIQIPISELPNKSVSVTFPDSYITMTNSKKPYYEKVYFISEIQDFLSEYGIPKDEVPKTYEKYWEGDLEKYYEVQVWDDEILRPYDFFMQKNEEFKTEAISHYRK